MRVQFERQVLGLFDRMLDQPPEARERWLESAAGGDAELVRAVLALVEADRRSASLPTVPPLADSAVDLPPVPELLGKYRLGRELGRGGMGIVYLAERADGLFEQRVAVKLIRSQVADRAVAAFEAERRLLARIEHPHVARLIDGGVAPDGRPWLATEYVEGAPIDRACTGRPLAARLRLFLQAAQAVAFAHGRLIAHGDVKPANILVDADERVRLLDFGVARLIGPELFQGGGAFTPGFASAERLAGGAPSVADDIFALGRTLAAIADDAPDREVDAIVRQATAPEDRRYQTVAALADDVARRLAGRPVRAMGGGGSYRLGKFLSRHRFGALATGLALLALAGSAIVAQRNYRRAEQARAAEALRFADAHRTAHYLMFTLLDRLERRPGTLRLRAQVGDVAQVYLDRLAASPDAPRDVRLDVAKGYLRATAMAGMGTAPNLADLDRAQRDLTAAAAMLARLQREEPHWPALAGPIAQVASLKCQNQIYGDHDARRALVEADAGERRLAALLPPGEARAVAGWPIRLCGGDALVWLDRAGRAIPMLERDLAAARIRVPRDDHMIERNLRVLGQAYYYAGRLPDAERIQLEAARLQAAAHAREPFYGPAVIEGANAADDLASTYEEQHRYADELRVTRAALERVEAQAALDPDDLQSARRALSLDRLVATALSGLGRKAEAAALMRRANAGWDTMQRRLPSDATTARLRLLALKVTGELERDAGQAAAACATYAMTAQGWTTFAARWRLSPSDADENVRPVRAALARCPTPLG